MTDNETKAKKNEIKVTFSVPSEKVMEWLRSDVTGYAHLETGYISGMTKEKGTYKFEVMVTA